MMSPDPERLAVCVPEQVVYRDFAEQTVALNLQTGPKGETAMRSNVPATSS